MYIKDFRFWSWFILNRFVRCVPKRKKKKKNVSPVNLLQHITSDRYAHIFAEKQKSVRNCVKVFAFSF